MKNLSKLRIVERSFDLFKNEYANGKTRLSLFFREKDFVFPNAWKTYIRTQAILKRKLRTAQRNTLRKTIAVKGYQKEVMELRKKIDEIENTSILVNYLLIHTVRAGWFVCTWYFPIHIFKKFFFLFTFFKAIG